MRVVDGVKTCTKCKLVSTDPPKDFSADRGRADGLNPWCRPCTRENVKNWRRNNRAYVLAYMRKQNAAWRKKNPKKDRARSLLRYKRLTQAPGGQFNPARPDYLARLAYYGGCCAYCRGPFEGFDHSIPIARGGSNFASNIRPICHACNGSKYTKTPAEFLSWLAVNKPGHGRGNGRCPRRSPRPRRGSRRNGRRGGGAGAVGGSGEASHRSE